MSSIQFQSICSFVFVVIALGGCSSSSEKEAGKASEVTVIEANLPVNRAVLRELTDEEYPDNPDIEIRSVIAQSFTHGEISFEERADGNWDVHISGERNDKDSLIIRDIDLMEWIPTIPDHVKEDEYLKLITVVNQEWNRQQVQLTPDQYHGSGMAAGYKRVDLARNCLNSGLWEVLTYVEEDNKLKPAYHGWFDFPDSLYRALFYKRNGIVFETYEDYLINWKDPKSVAIDLTKLRLLRDTVDLKFYAFDNDLYEPKGEQQKKAKNIINPTYKSYPFVPQDFQTDSTLFATFSPPGFYNTSDPRKTQLSRFDVLNNVTAHHIHSPVSMSDSLMELQFEFESPAGEIMYMVVGFDLTRVPQLAIDQYQKGYKMPMGVATHSFYEAYPVAIANPSTSNPFYAVLLDKDGKWLDSHAIGIDGPLFQFDENDPNELCMRILSFERHAIIGHYVIKLPEWNVPAS